MKKTLMVVAGVGILAAAGAGFVLRHKHEELRFRLVPVTRGSVTSTVTATGTLGAVRTVQVGTQVSGQIAHLYADFNDHVRQGQIVAMLDTTVLAQAVTSAQADLAKAQADLSQKQYLLAQADSLHRANLLAEADYRTALYNYQTSQAGMTSARTSLARAEQNLRYAVIRSPIDGVVIERDVDVGQTVAASLQAPQLFLVAQDLTRMQILTSVDESDIGRIRQGQNVQFTVQAFPTRKFLGSVSQVRLQSRTDQNVVSYTVVVGVNNADLALLPGMTATVNFIVAQADSSLTVPTAALRFRPPAELIARIPGLAADTAGFRGGRRDTSRTRAGGGQGGQGEQGARAFGARGGAGFSGGGGFGNGAGAAGMPQFSFARLFYVDSAGNPQVMRVRVGITDGQKSVVMSRDSALKEGLEVITGVLEPGQTAASQGPASPFQQQQGGFRRPGGF